MSETKCICGHPESDHEGPHRQRVCHAGCYCPSFMLPDPNYCPGCEPDGFYAHVDTCPNLIDVEVSTEGARHVPAAELRERAVIEANEARARVLAAHDRLAMAEPKDLAQAAPAIEWNPGAADLACSSETRVKRNLHNHTHRCQRIAGHEGGHEWKDGSGRTIIWYGEAKPLPTDMRYRFGLDPHWLMKREGRKTMASDFDSEW